MSPLIMITLLVIGLFPSGCVHQPPIAQAERYITTEGLNQLPDRRLAITSFGIEFDTKLIFAPARSCHHLFHGVNYPASQVDKEIALRLTKDRMQSLADQVYTQLIEDLQAVGYDVIPYETYKELPAYRSLVELAGHGSPVSITFTIGDPENPVRGEALVFAPTELIWYSPALEELGSRLGETLSSLSPDLRLIRRGLLGGNAVSQAEVDLANALNATLVKAYYVVSPVRSFVETTSLEGGLLVEGQTIVGRGETRLAFQTPGTTTSHRHLGKSGPPQDGNAFVRLTRDILVNKASQDPGTYLAVIGKLFILAMMAER